MNPATRDAMNKFGAQPASANGGQHAEPKGKHNRPRVLEEPVDSFAPEVEPPAPRLGRLGRDRQVATAEAAIALMRKRAWDDFYYFAKYVVGFDKMEEQPHRELCDLLCAGITESPTLGIDCVPPNTTSQRKSLRKLILWPRGSFKSSISSQAFPLWLLWHNPNLRILIDSETMHNAKTYLAGIRSVIEHNRMVRLICVNEDDKYALEPAYKTANGFTDDSVILATRTNANLKEPTLFCSGVDNARTGMHVDVIIMDDLVSERNVTTTPQIEKTYDHYRMSRSLLDPGGLQVVIGTRYHLSDMYGQLIDLHSRDAFDDIDSMSVTVKPAIDDDGVLLFPQRLTNKFLEDQRKAQGSYIFSCQYLLNPIDAGDAVFQDHDIQRYDTIPNESIVVKYLSVDPTVTDKARSDFFVVMVVGITRDNHVYVLDYVQKKMLPREGIQTIISMYQKWSQDGKLRMVGIETYAAQRALKLPLREEMMRCGVNFRIAELNHGRTSKEDHIMTKIQPVCERHELHVRPHMMELINQLVEYPRVRHDDLLDGLAYAIQMMRPGGASFEHRKPVYEPVSRKTGY